MSEKTADQFRNYDNAKPGVRELYRLNHEHQTLEFVLHKKAQYYPLKQARVGIWDMLEEVDQIIDESDPDTSMSQLQHALQTAEAIRATGAPREMILVGLIHDLGKVLCLFGEPQWAVVGDTFPVGCQFSEKIKFYDFFANSSDSRVPVYRTLCGIYVPHCGLDSVHFSWGHDEYLYHVVRMANAGFVAGRYLSPEGLAIIRYHSAYPIHQDGEYTHLMNDHDYQVLTSIKWFQRFDLYSKAAEPVDVKAVKPFYQQLISEYLPGKLCW